MLVCLFDCALNGLSRIRDKGGRVLFHFFFLKMLLSSLLGCSFFFRKCFISQFVKGLTPILCVKFVVSDPKQGWTGTICFVYFENASCSHSLGF